jgi:hypothetical protein
MATAKNKASNGKQELFRNMLVGVLLYTVVLGFFNDYTDILHTGTYSLTFSLAVVMQVLTYLTFAFKDWVIGRFPEKREAKHTVGLAFSVWLIMFLSKFVFLWVISVIFDEVKISGFIGLLLIVASLTLVQKLVMLVDDKLGRIHI